MFAVPGWAVSAASLTQEPSGSSKSAPAENSADLNVGSKKRKNSHSREDKSRKIAGSDLERLWNERYGDRSTRNPSIKSKDRHNAARAGKFSGIEQSIPSETKSAQKRKDKRNTDRKDGRDGISEGATIEADRSAAGKKLRKPNNRSKEQDTVSQPSNSLADLVPPPLPPPPPASKNASLTPLQIKMRNKLTSARFRHLNQTLYTTSSKSAFELFTNSPDQFAEYHAGFSQQVKDSWPQNPVDGYILAIKARARLEEGSKGLTHVSLPLPRRKTGSCTIADLGCGDAPLARGCQSQVKALQLKFHNFDLHAVNNYVTKADIANLPLRDGEADIAIFCLSLMGTNWINFVEETWRILRGDGKGEVWVAEVKSRFGRITKGRVVENSVGKKKKPIKNNVGDGNAAELYVDDDEAAAMGDGTDISAFVDVFRRRGFVLRDESVDKRNKMFVSMVFVKSGVPSAGRHKGLKWNGHEYQRQSEGITKFTSKRSDQDELSPEDEAAVLKPCVYKTR